MDDVGQTLLNWASAFGTLEMVGYLQLYRFESVFFWVFLISTGCTCIVYFVTWVVLKKFVSPQQEIKQ